MLDSDMWWNTLPAVIGFVSGVLTGTLVAFITHLFAARRERENREHADTTAKEARKRNFLSFLDGFRAEAERSMPRDFSAVFRDRIYEFRRESAKIRGDIDLGKQEKFAQLITDLCQITDSQVEYVGDGNEYVGRRHVTEAKRLCGRRTGPMTRTTFTIAGMWLFAWQWQHHGR